MTEAGWLACADPRAMLRWLTVHPRGGRVGVAVPPYPPSSRKLRLFACASARLALGKREDPRIVAVVEAAEQFADGLVTAEALKIAREAGRGSISQGGWTPASLTAEALHLARETGRDSINQSDWNPARQLAIDCGNPTTIGAASSAVEYCHAPAYRQARALYAAMLREVVANPFQPPPQIGLDWLAFSNGTAAKLGRSIYDEGAFDRLPILADALEDAGCTNADILAHCRGPGPHVRGCWVIDLLLGKT